MKACTSCNKHVVDNFVEFPCPGDTKIKVIRCSHCRESARPYIVKLADGTVYTGP